MAVSVSEAAPHLVSEWSPRNESSPSQVSSGSNGKVWWTCSLGHEWIAQVNNRVVRGSGCPYCSGRQAIPGETDLATLRPDIAEQWHRVKNGRSRPSEVTTSSGRKVWWSCSRGHEWEATVFSRVRGNGCPFCSGRRAIPGETDLITLRPDIAEQWNYAKNVGILPSDVSHGSGINAWWICEKGHEWEATVYERTGGNGCPYCSGRRAVIGETDLATLHPDIAAQWSPNRNGLTPELVTSRSNRKVWWVCEKGHEWEAMVNNRTLHGQGCPFCSGRRPIPGETDLVTTHPDVAMQWHKTRNDASPEMVSAGSHRKVWWVCANGHEWEASVYDRALSGHGCPYCSGRRPIPGETDLMTLRPDIAGQWNYAKNLNESPSDVSAGSHRKVWWVCEKGHEWRAGVTDRTRTNDWRGCPQCAAATYVSRGESELADIVKSWGIDVQTTVRSIPGVREVDILATGSNGDQTAIEFNGLYWHSERFKSRNYHHEKTLTLKNAGFKVVHVWEDDWALKRPVVEKMLRHKLGVSDAEPVHARKTIVTPVTVDESRQFLEENHIQGYVPGSVRFGLRLDDVLVAVMVFRRRGEDSWELSRYATNAPVRGGFSKLLTHFKQAHHPARIVSFSDNLISDGVMYEANGFKNDGAIPPDYTYIVNGKREHKFNYRLRRFRNDPDLEYRDGMTERELAELNRLVRVYDGGKTRWVLEDDRIG